VQGFLTVVAQTTSRVTRHYRLLGIMR
jgi:hypothetical protein